MIHMTDRAEMFRWARILGLIGGVIVLLGALAFAALFAVLGFVPFALSQGFGAGVEGGAAIAAAIFGAIAFFAVVGGLVLGGLALYGATQYEKPAGKTWGIVVLIVGVLAFFTGGGFGIGSALIAASGGLAVYAHSQAP